MTEPEDDAPPEVLPFPESQCHACSAPPRFVRTKRSVFIMCPRVPSKYPPQPVFDCEYFTPKEEP